MRFWLTTHYPHPIPDNHPWHVYIQDKFTDIAGMIMPGDAVLFYETKYNRLRVNGTKRSTGAQGIVVAGTIERRAEVRRPEFAVAEYVDGSRVNYRWGVPTRERELERSGFVPREKVCMVLGYKRNYLFRGFGIRGSGVRELNEAEYNELLNTFRRGQRPSGT